MANFSQTLTDSIRFLTPATTFGAPMKWGVDKWGNDIGSTGNFNLPTNLKNITNNAGPTLLDGYTTQANFNIFPSDSLVFSQGSGQAEYLFDGSGKYKLVFFGGATNDENASRPTYTVQASLSSTWTLSTNSSTSWIGS